MKHRPLLLNAVAMLLTVALLLCQFMPFWHYNHGEDERALAIQTYVWMPTDNQDVEDYFEEATGKEYNINVFVTVPLLIVSSAIAGLLFFCFRPASIMPGILSVIGGLSGTLGYLLDPVLQLGSNWPLHLVLSILLLCAGVVSTVLHIRDRGGKV